MNKSFRESATEPAVRVPFVDQLARVPMLEGPRAAQWSELRDARSRPAILRGLARDWPIVRAGQVSARKAIDYLLSFYDGRLVVGFTGSPEIRGKFAYDAGVTHLNFESTSLRLDDFLERLYSFLEDPESPSLYIGSARVDATLPGFRSGNDLRMESLQLSEDPPVVSLSMGNRTVAAAHYDASHNMACCLVGRRRFTLFPPNQVANLYPGPLEPTPGGQAISLVDFDNPDFLKHPGAAEAIASALVAELEPGDVLYYPALWWHQVEAIEPFNVMMNYWWDSTPAFIDSPQAALLHAMLCLRDRSSEEKVAWKALFEYYVFGSADAAIKHLPEPARGVLAPLNSNTARRLRALVLKGLNR